MRGNDGNFFAPGPTSWYESLRARQAGGRGEGQVLLAAWGPESCGGGGGQKATWWQRLGHRRFPQTSHAPRSWRTQWLLLYPVNPRSRSRPAWVLITNIEAAAQRPLDPLWAVATSNITLCMLRFSGRWTTCSYSCLLCPTQTLTITDIRVPATVLVASIANASNMPVDEL